VAVFPRPDKEFHEEGSRGRGVLIGCVHRDTSRDLWSPAVPVRGVWGSRCLDRTAGRIGPRQDDLLQPKAGVRVLNGMTSTKLRLASAAAVIAVAAAAALLVTSGGRPAQATTAHRATLATSSPAAPAGRLIVVQLW
jgi:hypothetical protein